MKRKTSNRLLRKERVYKEIIRKHIFNDYFYSGDLQSTLDSIEKYRGVLMGYLHCLYNYDNIHGRHFKKENKRNGWNFTPDTRTGWETYGFDSIESIEGNLSYIADRFGSEFRIHWMLDIHDGINELNNNK